MEKPKKSLAEIMRGFVKEFPDLQTDGKVLICGLCSVNVNQSRLSSIKQQLETTKHRNLKQRASGRASRQLLLFEKTTDRGFQMELADLFISCDIPLHKLRLPRMKQFWNKFTEEHVPSETVIREKCIPNLFDELMAEIREHVKNKFIWISIDETVDSSKRCVVIVVVGVMEEEGKKFLLRTEMLDTVNHKVIARLFQKSLDSLGPDFDKDNVLLFLTDAAPYMVAAGNVVCEMYDKLIHVTGIVHGLHRVCEQIRNEFANVNCVISNVKKIFSKAPNRIRTFKSLQPNLTLPPEPVTTRWGTWLSAALYYADHFDQVAQVVNEFDDEEAVAIKEAKMNLADPLMPAALQVLCTNFPLCCKNKGLQRMLLIEKAISLKDKFESYTLEEMKAFEWALLTSVDVERSFSMYKHYYRDNRTKFTEENLTKTFIIYCNRNI